MESAAEALSRLDTTLSLLETALARRLEADEARGDRETELALMEEDRARLATELDAASERLARMTAASGEVERRLGHAIGAVESLVHGRTRLNAS